MSPQQWAQVHYLSLPILAKTNSPEGCLAYGEYVFELPPAPHHVELVETILQAIYNRQDTLILEPAGAAKCQPGSARVAMASGELRALRDVRPGEDVVGLTDDLRLVRATVRDARPTGRKPIVTITTRGGHIARVSDVHRLRAFAGWREARDLEVGDYLAAPRQLPVGTHSLDHEAKLLAYWIAEGCRTTTYSSVAISNTTPEILADARSAATAMGWGVTETKEGGRVVGLRFTGREPGGHGWNLARRWLLSHGLDTRTMGAWEKHVPTAVLESDELTTALFLSRLFGCDGSISVKHGRGRDGAVIAYTSVSRRLIEDIRHLLLRFGIISSVRQIKTRAGAYRGTAWLLSITDAYSVAHFVNRIGLFGKQAKARALIADARRDRGNALHERIPRAWHRLRPPLARRYNGPRVRFDNLAQGTTRAGVATVARATGDETLRMLAESDVWWDQIVSIVSDGEEETFDLQVEDVESYVSDGLISHNTTWGNRNFLSWLISMFPDVRVGLFSETATFSESFSRSIMTAFEANSRHREMFGDLVNGGKWTVGEWIRKGSRVSETKDLTLFAGGTGGQVASKRFDVLLLDDILGKSNTDTPDQRLKVKSWFDIALRPRRAPGAVTVGLGTRWSPEDLYELLALATAQGGYGFFLLLRRALIETPEAECECGDPAHGGWVSYWPSFWKLHDLMRMREQNPAAFDCAYMNDIAGLIAGDVFQTSWVQYYGTKTGDPFLELPSDRSFSTRTGVDLATSTKQRADFTAATSSAMDGNGNYFVMRSQRDRISVGHANWIAEFYTALPTGVVVVESNQHQSTVAQEMMRDYPRIPVKAHHTDSDKDQRARAVAEKYRMRKVWHHESLRDGDLEREMRAYPKGHDDLIDSLGMSMELGGSSFFYGKLSGRRPTPEQVMSRLRQPYSLTGS